MVKDNRDPGNIVFGTVLHEHDNSICNDTVSSITTASLFRYWLR